jgi:hypothetical protein
MVQIPRLRILSRKLKVHARKTALNPGNGARCPYLPIVSYVG